MRKNEKYTNIYRSLVISYRKKEDKTLQYIVDMLSLKGSTVHDTYTMYISIVHRTPIVE